MWMNPARGLNYSILIKGTRIQPMWGGNLMEGKLIASYRRELSALDDLQCPEP